MEDEIQENGVVEETIDSKEQVSSWSKVCCWLSLILSLTVPLVSIGLSIMSLSSPAIEEDKECRNLCYISIAISVYFVLSDAIVGLLGI